MFTRKIAKERRERTHSGVVVQEPPARDGSRRAGEADPGTRARKRRRLHR